MDSLFEVEVLRPDGKCTVHRVPAKNAKEAEAIVHKMLEPDIVESPKIVRTERCEST